MHLPSSTNFTQSTPDLTPRASSDVFAQMEDAKPSDSNWWWGYVNNRESFQARGIFDIKDKKPIFHIKRGGNESIVESLSSLAEALGGMFLVALTILDKKGGGRSANVFFYFGHGNWVSYAALRSPHIDIDDIVNNRSAERLKARDDILHMFVSDVRGALEKVTPKI